MEIFVLLILFQLKHFFADYPLQTQYMLGKFKTDGWILPLSSHCIVHAVTTFTICIFFTDFHTAWALSLFDFWAHFSMDRVKASPGMLGRFKPTQKRFWWVLGADQMWHHLTHYAIIYFLMKNSLDMAI